MTFFAHPAQVTRVIGSKCVHNRLFGLDTKPVLVDKENGEADNYQDT